MFFSNSKSHISVNYTFHHGKSLVMGHLGRISRSNWAISAPRVPKTGLWVRPLWPIVNCAFLITVSYSSLSCWPFVHFRLWASFPFLFPPFWLFFLSCFLSRLLLVSFSCFQVSFPSILSFSGVFCFQSDLRGAAPQKKLALFTLF